jgi:DNA-binding NtrC family response regulator
MREAPHAARLAIVDDDDVFREYLRTMLRSRGYDVTTYGGGQELLDALRHGAAPDVVLLDVLMPGLNGMETLRAVRERAPGMQIIMLSGQHVPSAIVESVRAGAVDYVVKPDDPEGVGEAALEGAICTSLEKRTLVSEVARLRAYLPNEPDGSQLCWHESSVMRRVLATIDRVADSDVSVLITGESGVGKEVIARELHRRSSRRTKHFVKVNCAALPAELLESELFGHERGAFTGAMLPRVGKFEHASGGTIFLDEVGEIPLALQPKLLHVLQDGQLTKLGSNDTVTVDARVIAATNRSLAEMIRAKQFRTDLYYRLQVIEISVPPLRERRQEIPLLTDFFLVTYAKRYGRPLRRPSSTLRAALEAYAWPGNVRELENLVKRHVILQDEALVLNELTRSNDKHHEPGTPAAPADAPAHAAPAPLATAEGANLSSVAREAALRAEREAIERALTEFRWNRRQAARVLGVSYKTLLNKMKACGFAVPGDQAGL